MSKNIYEILGFKKADSFIHPKEVINEAKAIFNKLPLRIVGIRPLIIEQTVLEETLAISTAEDSDLTLKEAKKIQVSEAQEARLMKYKQDKTLSDNEKYDQLEYENIRAVENAISDISFKDLTVNLICELHQDLTVGLDRYSKEKGVSSYHPGQLRQSDRVKVGKLRKYIPPKYKEIKKLLETLFRDFVSKKMIELTDILEFHILFYAIHPFQNGNKRVARILESMLLAHYGYSANRTISLALYYTDKKDAANLFIMESLLKREVTPFINFAIRGYFYAGYQLFQKVSDIYMEAFQENFNRYIEQSVKEIHRDNYKKAGKAIMSLNGVFTHTEFVEQMKKHKCTLGVSQTIIQTLYKNKVLRKKGNEYYYEKAPDIQSALENLINFLLHHNISLT